MGPRRYYSPLPQELVRFGQFTGCGQLQNLLDINLALKQTFVYQHAHVFFIQQE